MEKRFKAMPQKSILNMGVARGGSGGSVEPPFQNE